MQGFNMGRYVPPDLEGTISANKVHNKHALGNRASKLASHGILTVRFEMPFPIWCATCPKPTIIGQGVRFNAEKKRCGSYYSTPIWSFRFRHVVCGGWIEMRTDPKNTAYVVVEGATKRDTGEDKVRAEEGDVRIMTDQEREALRKNAFANLERTIEDREQLKRATERIEDLMDVSARHWEDPYAQNQRLRKAFRVGRQEREKAALRTGELVERMGLGIEVLPETEEDRQRAALVEFGGVTEEKEGEDVDSALSKPLFAKTASSTPVKSAPSETTGSGRRNLKSEPEAEAAAAAKQKESLVSRIMNNTRSAQDPFLQAATGKPASSAGAGNPGSRLLPGVKRKLAVSVAPDTAAAGVQPSSESATAERGRGALPPAKVVVIGDASPSQSKASTTTSALVEYDSD